MTSTFNFNFNVITYPCWNAVISWFYPSRCNSFDDLHVNYIDNERHGDPNRASTEKRFYGHKNGTNFNSLRPGDAYLRVNELGLSSVRRQAITWINADVQLIGLIGTTFSEIFIKINKLFQ